MTACRLLSWISVVLLLVLPLCMCDRGAASFSTRSARPWSHRRRWRVPLVETRVAGSGKACEKLVAVEISDTSSPNCILVGTGPRIVSVNESTERIAHRQVVYRRPADRGGVGDGGSGGTSEAGREKDLHLCREQQHDLPNVGLQGSQILYTFGLFLWLGLLFYLLGTTASDYFSCTLEKLSDVLNLSPAVAGVTLLAIGNGAPDVFSTVVAFAASDHTGSIGLGSVLGGSLFITTVVTGTVALVTCKGKEEPRLGIHRGTKFYNPQITSDSSSLTGHPVKKSSHGSLEDGLIHEKEPLLTIKEAEAITEGLVVVDWASFVRDVAFLLVSSGVLTLILMDGEVHLWEAVVFLGIYLCYTVFVWTAEVLQRRRRRRRSSFLEPLMIKDAIENAFPEWAERGELQERPHQHHHPHYHVHSQEVEEEMEHLWKDPGDRSFCGKAKRWLMVFYKYGIEWVLAWPRRLTIPVVEEERWSRKIAIASCTLAPVFVAAVWSLDYSDYSVTTIVALGVGAVFGVVLGSLAYWYTDEEQPPQNFLTLWLAGGFLMSIVWFYIIATELVESLEILGSIFGISTSILALTVLAWGNSVGDLVADVALACSGPDGVQIAISGCYAGPLFNIVVGLGLSLIIGCWNSEPNAYQIVDKDGSLFYIVGFLAIGLVWAVVILPLQGMRLGRVFGIGLILLYSCFFVVGMCYTAGLLT